MSSSHPAAVQSSPIVLSDSPASEPATQPLRIGILLDDTVAPAWVERVLQQIVGEGIGEIALVMINDASQGPVSPQRRTLLQRAKNWYDNRDELGYRLYQRLDEARYQGDNSPNKMVDLSPLIKLAPTLRIQPRMTRFCDYFPEEQLEAIAAYQLDVALRFGFRILRAGALRIARHGVWSFHHGDNTVNRGGPAGYWEVIEGQEVTGAVLQRLTEDLDGGEIIRRSFSSTNQISATANCCNFYWQAAELMVAALRELSREHDKPAAANESPPLWSAYSNRLYKRPDTREMIWHGLKLGTRLLRSKLRETLFREQWAMAYRLTDLRGPAGEVPDGVFYRFKEVLPPRDRFWADPFPVHADGRHWLFFEEFPYDQPHAHICVAEVTSEGMGEPRPVLKRPYHLSYPALFQWGGHWYMTPETESRSAVELYRASHFPFEWEYQGELLSGLAAVDPTITRIGDRWWMFLGVMVPGAREATALHIYSADSPLGPWKAHARNPVKVDVRGARPGGQVFFSEGRYYRVGQDGAPSYGSGLRVFVIDHIDDDDYRETEIEKISPAWRKGLVGAHTLNASGGLTAIDVRLVQRRF